MAASRCRFNKEQANELRALAEIELLNSQLGSVETQMAESMKFHDSVIMVILSIGYINGRMMLEEIGEIHCFSSPAKLLVFAGLDA